MGSVREQWQKLPDLSPALRVPVMLLVTALLCFGFFPQVFVRNVAPTFGTFLSANTSHFANMQRYSHGAVSADGAEFIASLGQAPQDPWNNKAAALGSHSAARKSGAADVTDENASQARRYNDLATK